MKDYLKKEAKFYEQNKDEYKKKYLGKVLIISKKALVGVFNSENEAIDYSIQNKLKRNTYMIKTVGQEEEVAQIIGVGF